MINNCKIIDLKCITDQRGNLTPIEGSKDIPFYPKRVYYLYGVPQDEERGVHAHKKLQQVIICLQGCVDITLDNGKETQTVTLDSPIKGLYIFPMTWKSMYNFAPNTICLVLASAHHEKSDYYYDYNKFVKDVNGY